MKVVDIFDGNYNLIERTAVEDLGFDPKTDIQSMFGYAQKVVYENSYYDWMDKKNISPKDYNKYHDKADYYAAGEANYANWIVCNIADHI